jgi:hypothetical protein
VNKKDLNQWKTPYQLATGSGYTLILTPRSAPYTVTDLLSLAPSTFLLQSDGSYLLLESLYVMRGATLALSGPGGLKLRMASNADGFVSIVSYGGDIVLTGTAGARMLITSWDPRTDKPDTDTTNGRAYIRTIGGSFTMSYVDVVDLGFWSGRTGGIGLTGTTKPISGSTSSTSVTGAGSAPNTSGDQGAAKPGDVGALGDSGVQLSPAGPLSAPDDQFEVPGVSFVTIEIDHDTITGDAFGLFISGATGIEVSDTQVTGSLIDGIVLERYANDALVQDDDSSHNDGDGFVVSRAASDVQLVGCTAYYNAGNGYTVDGEQISDGPSASGEPTGAYGNNTVSNSLSQGNKQYGFDVIGGLNIALDDNSIVGNQMGIVVRKSAQQVLISGNRLLKQDRQGISILDGVQGVTINNNVIDGAATGIYVRNASADITGNTVNGASIHGVTLLDDDAGSLVNGNVVAGIGSEAIDTHREQGRIAVSGNQTAGWYESTALWVRVRSLISPQTVVWLSLFVFVAFFSLKGKWMRGTGYRRDTSSNPEEFALHPYAQQSSLDLDPPFEPAGSEPEPQTA